MSTVSSASLVPAHCGCLGTRSSRASAAGLPPRVGLVADGTDGNLACRHSPTWLSTAGERLNRSSVLCRGRRCSRTSLQAGLHARDVCMQQRIYMHWVAFSLDPPKAGAAGAAGCGKPLSRHAGRCPRCDAALCQLCACTHSIPMYRSPLQFTGPSMHCEGLTCQAGGHHGTLVV